MQDCSWFLFSEGTGEDSGISSKNSTSSHLSSAVVAVNAPAYINSSSADVSSNQTGSSHKHFLLSIGHSHKGTEGSTQSNSGELYSTLIRDGNIAFWCIKIWIALRRHNSLTFWFVFEPIDSKLLKLKFVNSVLEKKGMQQ